MHTIEGLDTRQVELPAEMLSIDLAEVRHKEGVLVSGLAELIVDALDALAEGLADQLLGETQVLMVAMVVVMFMAMLVQAMIACRLYKDMIVRVLWIIERCEAIGENSRHNHDPRFDESGSWRWRRGTKEEVRERSVLSRLIRRWFWSWGGR